ncbi:unnamed protein product, partial [marine sediment metagenome]
CYHYGYFNFWSARSVKLGSNVIPTVKSIKGYLHSV